MHKRSTSPNTKAVSLEENNTSLKYYDPLLNRSSTSLGPTSYAEHLKHFWRTHLDYFWGLLFRVISLIVIIGVLIAIGIGLRYTDNMPKPEDFSHLEFNWKINPRDYLQPYNTSFQYNVLLDGHSHSTYSDGKMNVRQLLDWHIANGYNAIMVTDSDHNTIEGGLAAEKLALEEYNDTIVVIPGMEYTCCRIHMNFIDINETVPVTGPVPSDEELQKAINRVHELGGLVIVNHIPWSNTTEDGYQLPRLPNHPSVEQLIQWGVDGFEVINQETFDLSTYQSAVQHNLIQMVGMDLHHPSVGAQVWLTINAPNMTRAGIMQEIRARRTSFLFDPAGTHPRVYVDSPASYLALTPLTYLGDYFGMFYDDMKGMYSFQGTFCHPEVLTVHKSVIGWFIFWVLIFLVVFELVRLLMRWCLSGLGWLSYPRVRRNSDIE
ncbi:polymerase/histidinol phosphatase-like protein [Gilbertella persicaria]|uniref:polymerase/histidinol phosphatase-like protein n=1 Tax=Gilbertella persicaria TaxID=101096 RepID=UPI00221F65BA|nr:polymerase/histidinol phosphatase-like protein [Gilbertella persicaria]KAI8095127.1 polymerase/histidinol phosphatase-like protein [Gilbertella persicaria]